MNHLLASPAAERALGVEFPAQEQAVASSRCIVQISGPDDAQIIEISVDRGPWRSCIRACGFWWHECGELGNGPHRLSVRGQARDGTSLNALPRRFSVK